MNIVGDIEELRGARILGVAIVVTPLFNQPTKEALQIRFIPKRCRRPRIMLIDGENLLVNLTLD